MKLRKGILIALAGLLLSSAPASAQMPKIDPEQRYLLLAASATATMLSEMNYAADKGFRVVAASMTVNVEMAVVMERAAKPPETYRYRLVATTDTITMQKELSEAARDGYRVAPNGVVMKHQVMVGPEVVIILEKAPGLAKQYEYQFLATTLTSTMQKEISQSAAQGYRLVALMSRGELMAVMEREVRP